jgi:cardiolipin synthase A/B
MITVTRLATIWAVLASGCADPDGVGVNPPPPGYGEKNGAQVSGVSEGCTGDSCVADAWKLPTTGPQITSYFLTPTTAGLQPVITAIGTAQTSINMEIYHLTEMPIVDALVAAANTGVTVQLIIDQDNWNNHTSSEVADALTGTAGITVTPSSTAFRITHEKSFVIDDSVAFIMSLNLTSPYTTTRDYAVSTTNAGVIAEFQSVFAADLTNAQNSTATTPTLKSEYVVVSPVNSETRLTALVASAKTTLIASSENLGDPDIQAAMIAAAARGVQVQVMAPMCDQNSNTAYDIPYLTQLAAGGVQALAMPPTATATQPYIHAKMIVADGARAYIGSVNLSTASTTDARELGILFTDANAIGMIQTAFASDWALAQPPAMASSVTCPATTD